MRVLVLDHESTDDTVAIARARGANVIVRPFAGFVNARRFALAQVKTPWAFMIDADERPDETLRDAIASASENIGAYTLSRTTYYRGKPLRMWRNERLLRLFRTDCVRLEAAPAAGGGAQLHERWTCDEAPRTLAGTLEHYSYPDAASYLAKFAAYTTIEAQDARGGVAALLLQSLLVPLRFVHALIRRGALLDGADGWFVAWYSALYPAVVQWKALRS